MATYNGLVENQLGKVIRVVNGQPSPPPPKMGQIWPRGSKNTAG